MAAKNISSGAELINTTSSFDAKASSIDPRLNNSAGDGTKLIQINQHITRSGTGAETQPTVAKQASVGIKESIDSGLPIKIDDSTLSDKSKNAPIVNNLKHATVKKWTIWTMFKYLTVWRKE